MFNVQKGNTKGYVRKSKSTGVVISLSGGADSASVSVLSALMLRMAYGQLGWDGLKEKF